jgi:multiple sugar transport system permease protein
LIFHPQANRTTTAYRKLDFGYASAVATLLLALLLLYAMLLLRMRRQLLQL